MHCFSELSPEGGLQKFREGKMPWFSMSHSHKRPGAFCGWRWVGIFAVLPQLATSTAYRIDSGSSGCVIGGLHLTQAVCFSRLRHPLDRQRSYRVSLLGSEESFFVRKVRAFEGHSTSVGEKAGLSVCASGPCFCPVPSKYECYTLGREAKEKCVKETFHCNHLGTREHRTCLWEPCGNKEDMWEILESTMLQSDTVGTVIALMALAPFLHTERNQKQQRRIKRIDTIQ